RGELHPCPIHGDPKLANILFSRDTGRAVSLIDLDTVKPGLLHYDLGDCLRSCCNPAGEEAPLTEVSFNLAYCSAILRGYLPQVAPFFSVADYHYIYDAVRLIAFELGLRFFSDHLAGDIYFKVKRPGQNLQRAMIQFALCQSIEAQENEIRNIVRDCQRP
ncbi:MAG TPA: aminoglycoside phosphotransferase family protein, partial [Desulfurivibrionaceae bacterium]